MNEQHAYTFVKYSDIPKNWHFCTLIIVNISVAPSRRSINFWYTKIHLKTLKTSVVTEIRSKVGVYVNYEKNNLLILLISTQKSYFCDNDAIYEVIMKKRLENDVITTDIKSAGIHLLNYHSLRPFQSFSCLDKSTGQFCRSWP